MSYSIFYTIEIKQNNKWVPAIFSGKVYYNTRQDIVRDHLSYHGWYDCPFTQRGLPNDISNEIKEFVEKFEYKHDISYATLNEIESYYDTIEANYKSERSRVVNEYLLRQLKYVFNKDVTDPEFMDLRASFDEDLEDSEDSMLCFDRFIGELYGIAKLFNNNSWPNENEVRIIFFLG